MAKPATAQRNTTNPATTSANTSATPGTTAPRTTNAPRVAPELSAIRSDVPMPIRASNRGSKTNYPFGQLEVGQSFGVKNKTAEQMASIISNQNRKPGSPKLDANGAVIYKTNPLLDANGAKIGETPTTEPVLNEAKHFFAVNVDPKSDLDNAKVRVFRDK